MKELTDLRYISRTWFKDIDFESGESLLSIAKILGSSKILFQYFGSFLDETLWVVKYTGFCMSQNHFQMFYIVVDQLQLNAAGRIIQNQTFFMWAI